MGAVLLWVGCVAAREVPVLMTWTEDPTTTLTFSWERDTAGRGTVEWGTNSLYENSASDSGGYRRHFITIRGLVAGETYHYKVSSTDGFETEDNIFRTAPEGPEPLNFVVYGDSQRGHEPQTDHRGVIGEMMGSHPDFIINTGDMIDEQFNPGWQSCADFLAAVTDIVAEAVYMPTAGNHENPTDPNSYYWRLFSLPQKPSGGHYYSYEVGNIQFIALDSEENIAGQNKWLARTLQASAHDTNTSWVFPYFHRPPYTAGNHGPDETVKSNWCPLFVMYESDIVFNGHNHSYERMQPIRGVSYVVTGGGGAALYNVTSNAMHASTTACYHYVSIQMTGTVMRYQATRSDGLVFDDTTFTHEGRAVHCSPAFPMREESVAISYDASQGSLSAAGPVYLYLGIDDFTNALVDAAMTYNATSGRWEFDYTVPTNAFSRLAFVFHDSASTNWDNNYGYDWQLLLERVKFTPATAIAGDSLTLHYEDPLGPLSGAGQIYAHIGFDSWEYISDTDLVMTNQGDGVWEYTLPVPGYPEQMDVVFHDGTTWDDNDGLEWGLPVASAIGDPPWNSLPIVVEGTPAITDNPVGQNHVGDNFDFDLSGSAQTATDADSGFGDFGQIYFNSDSSNLYIGGIGADLGGTNNVMVLFLGLDTLTDDAENLWHKSGPPNTLDELHNVGFTEPMDVAIVLGDEYADGPDYPTFTYGGYDFGQGIYYCSTQSSTFTSMTAARLSQFDGSNTTACVSDDDDGNRQTDRWEASLPWSSLGATGDVDSIEYILLAGVIASDHVTAHNRYLSSTYLAKEVFGNHDAYGNFGANSITLEPVKILLAQGDVDTDGLPNLWEHENFGSAQGPGADDDQDDDQASNWNEYTAGTQPTNSESLFEFQTMDASTMTGGDFVITWQESAGRTYDLFRSTNENITFDPVASNLPSGIYTDSVSGVERANYRIQVNYEE